jgi:hypothetical protein
MHGTVALTQADDAAERAPTAQVSAIVGRVQCAVTVSDRLAAFGKYVRALIVRPTEGSP